MPPNAFLAVKDLLALALGLCWKVLDFQTACSQTSSFGMLELMYLGSVTSRAQWCVMWWETAKAIFADISTHGAAGSVWCEVKTWRVLIPQKKGQWTFSCFHQAAGRTIARILTSSSLIHLPCVHELVQSYPSVLTGRTSAAFKLLSCEERRSVVQPDHCLPKSFLPVICCLPCMFTKVWRARWYSA